MHNIDKIRAIVAHHFPVYNTAISADAVIFYVQVYEQDPYERFEALRKELKLHGYTPMLRRVYGETLLYVTKGMIRRKGSARTNIIMLLLTIISTGVAGTMLWASYINSESMFSLSNVINGLLYFSLPLLLILGSHELGHYLVSNKIHGVEATLPFFIPFIPPLGTLGALISMKEPIPNRKALLDIGIAGPITGFAVAFPLAILGLHLTNVFAQPAPRNLGDSDVYVINMPLIYGLLTQIVPLRPGVTMHPTLFAAWAGFLVTAINLLPIGQLDGGHVARALLGKKAKFLSYGAAAALVFLSGFYKYAGWLLFALLVVFWGLRHPPPLNDISRLDGRRLFAGFATLSLIVLCFVPVPITSVEAIKDYRIIVDGAEKNEIVLDNGAAAEFMVRNTGNTRLVLIVRFENSPALIIQNWSITAMADGYGNCSLRAGRIVLPLDSGSDAVITVHARNNNITSHGELTAYLVIIDSEKELPSSVVNIKVKY